MPISGYNFTKENQTFPYLILNTLKSLQILLKVQYFERKSGEIFLLVVMVNSHFMLQKGRFSLSKQQFSIDKRLKIIQVLTFSGFIKSS